MQCIVARMRSLFFGLLVLGVSNVLGFGSLCHADDAQKDILRPLALAHEALDILNQIPISKYPSQKNDLIKAKQNIEWIINSYQPQTAVPNYTPEDQAIWATKLLKNLFFDSSVEDRKVEKAADKLVSIQVSFGHLPETTTFEWRNFQEPAFLCSSAVANASKRCEDVGFSSCHQSYQDNSGAKCVVLVSGIRMKRADELTDSLRPALNQNNKNAPINVAVSAQKEISLRREKLIKALGVNAVAQMTDQQVIAATAK